MTGIGDSLFIPAGAPGWDSGAFTPVECGIDWVTLSGPISAVAAIEKVADAYRASEGLDGRSEAKPAIVRGYSGYRQGALFWGSLGEYCLLTISGNISPGVFGVIDWTQLKATRIDVQVTGYVTHYEELFGSTINDRLCFLRATERLDSRLKIPAILNNGRVETQYIGAPSSDNRMRIYDKTEESGEFYGVHRRWRIEVQGRRTAARGIAQMLAASPNKGVAISRFIAARMAHYGIECTQLGEPERVALTQTRREPDLDRQLAWALESTLPTWRRLLSHPEYREIASEALLDVMEVTKDELDWAFD